MNYAITIAVAILGCAEFWRFLQSWLDRKNSRKFDAEAAIKSIQDDVSGIRTDVKGMQNNQANMQRAIDTLSDIVAENEVTSKRVRILQSADEVMRGVQRSKDRCDQDLSDIDGYERYCASHPNFKNNQTEMSISLIKEQYRHDLEHGTFLTYKR